MRKWSKSQLFGIAAIGMNMICMLLEVLILCKVVPYDIYMGGRMKNYESAAGAAVVSIIIMLFLMGCLLIASGLVHNDWLKKFAIIMLKVFIVYYFINIIMNLLGKTWIKKSVDHLCALLRSIVCIE